MLSGEIGAGKTTLLRELLNRLDEDVTVGLVNNTHASFGNLMQWILGAFGLVPASQNSVDQYQQFVDFVIGEYAKNRHTLLIIDEAQQLTPESMEELRMLSNINSDKDFVLQVIIAGQNELRVKLQSPELTQFAQRISIDYHLEYLDMVDTSHYIRHRLQHAGGAPDLFDMSACRAIFENTGGVPRLINRLSDICLVYGYAAESKIISSYIVEAVLEDKQAGEFIDIDGGANIDEKLETDDVLNNDRGKDQTPEPELTMPDKEYRQSDLGLNNGSDISDMSKSNADYDYKDDDTIFSSLDIGDANEPDLFQADNDDTESEFNEHGEADEFKATIGMAAPQTTSDIPDLYFNSKKKRRAIIPVMLIALFTVISIFSVLDITDHEPEFISAYKNKIKAASANQYQQFKQARNTDKTEPIDFQETRLSQDPIIEDRINVSPIIVNSEKIDAAKIVTDSNLANKIIINNETEFRMQTDYQLSQEKAQLLRNNIQEAVDGMDENSETVVLDSAIGKEAESLTESASNKARTTDKEKVVAVQIENKMKKESGVANLIKARVVAKRTDLPKSDIAAAEMSEVSQSKAIKPDQKLTPTVTNDSVAARRAAARAALKRDREHP